VGKKGPKATPRWGGKDSNGFFLGPNKEKTKGEKGKNNEKTSLSDNKGESTPGKRQSAGKKRIKVEKNAEKRGRDSRDVA